ncbi:TerC family protein [Buchnera aphidicola]|uniref:TerC family protein n=1 Tax=Buchnera aphidicola TaxID=9 RepID=UPI003463C9AE
MGFFHPSNWIGLLTLVLLEIVLGIDNLIFIAILSKKLPPHERDKARLIGLGLSLIMRLILLSTISWMITLTHPIFNNKYISFSGREIILLTGGLFLLFKATIELHEKLEGHQNNNKTNKNYPGFWTIILQIVILDAIFSLDSVITAIGMVNKLFIMMLAVVIATSIMLIASKPLTKFVNLHQTIIVLCLSFLLMIGLSLVSESLGLYIPKKYIYVSIGFSVLIEIFNQIALYNFIKHESHRPIRQRASETILNFMRAEVKNQKKNKKKFKNKSFFQLHSTESNLASLKDEERYMIHGVLGFSGRSIQSMMTPRNEISWINVKNNTTEIRIKLLDTPHSLFPVCKGELDKIIGIVRAKELLVTLDNGLENIFEFASKNPPIIVLDTLDPINLLKILKKSKGICVIVMNEFGVVQGLITPLDLLEAIAGEFPDADETPEIIVEKDSWLVKGNTDIHSLGQFFKIQEFVYEKKKYASLAGLLISHYGKLPKVGENIYIPPLNFNIVSIKKYQINLIRITKNKSN